MSHSLLYLAKKSVSELRKLYFKMKDKVFGSVRFGVAYNTEALEQILKDELGSDTKLSDVEFPKYASVKVLRSPHSFTLY